MVVAVVVPNSVGCQISEDPLPSGAVARSAIRPSWRARTTHHHRGGVTSLDNRHLPYSYVRPTHGPHPRGTVGEATGQRPGLGARHSRGTGWVGDWDAAGNLPDLGEIEPSMDAYVACADETPESSSFFAPAPTVRRYMPSGRPRRVLVWKPLTQSGSWLRSCEPTTSRGSPSLTCRCVSQCLPEPRDSKVAGDLRTLS